MFRLDIVTAAGRSGTVSLSIQGKGQDCPTCGWEQSLRIFAACDNTLPLTMLWHCNHCGEDNPPECLQLQEATSIS